jgi:iron-sulfur cluster assembly protein
VIGLTERAAVEVKRIIREQHLPEGTALRVGVKGGGCSGFSYTLGFDDQVSEIDQIAERYSAA